MRDEIDRLLSIPESRAQQVNRAHQVNRVNRVNQVSREVQTNQIQTNEAHESQQRAQRKRNKCFYCCIFTRCLVIIGCFFLMGIVFFRDFCNDSYFGQHYGICGNFWMSQMLQIEVNTDEILEILYQRLNETMTFLKLN